MSLPPVENLALGQTVGYGVQIVHSVNEGIYASPVAGPPPQNASLVRLHAPFETISVYWSACSEGKPPIVPSSKSFIGNNNRVFLGGERVGICTPTLVGHIWQAAGVLHYCSVGGEVGGLDGDFFLAKCPWEGSLDTSFYLPKENFVTKGIFNPTYVQPPGLPVDPDVQALDLQMMIQG